MTVKHILIQSYVRLDLMYPNSVDTIDTSKEECKLTSLPGKGVCKFHWLLLAIWILTILNCQGLHLLYGDSCFNKSLSIYIQTWRRWYAWSITEG